jgi:dipeptidyl aminopeptidase/acylaminoacyl peptidase
VNVPIGWAPDDQIYYWHSSPTESGDVWVIAAAGGQPTRLTRNATLQTAWKLRAPQEVTIAAEGGEQVPALVYLPAYFQEGDRYPAIVWIRGGPTSVSRYDFVPICNWLANEGFVVVTPNYRGSTGFGLAHMRAVSSDGLGKADLSDVLAAGQFARLLPYVDASRGVGIGGRSWGGYLTLMAVTQAPDEFSCAVAGAAISDWRIQQAETEVRYYDRWLLGGWLYEQSERGRDRSPVSAVDRIKAPLLIYHGEDDRDVPFRQIKEFVEAAKRAGVSVDYKPYPLEKHSNSKPENQTDVLERTATFFRRHLQPWDLRENPSGGQIQY